MKKEIEDKLLSLGGIVPIGDAFVPVDENELTSLEASLGTVLPQDYREFLKTYGAAMFNEYVDFQPVRRLPMPISSTGKGHFCSFYGAMRDPYQSLEKEVKTFQGRMPDTIIPIGDDGGGNQICLGIRGKEQGNIYYWDHHNEWDEEEYMEEHGIRMPPEVKFQNVHLIAESFEDFINRLEISANG